MPMRSKISVAVGLSCLASAALGGSALAGGDGKGGGSALEVEVRGVVTGLTAATTAPAVAPATITVSPGGTLAPWTCTLRDGADTSAIVLNTTVVKLKCRDRDGVLTAKKARISDESAGKVKIKARGLVTAFTAFTVATPTAAIPGSITINPGTGLPPVTCAVTHRTRVRGIPVVGTGTVKVECKTKDGTLVAKKIKVAKDKGSSPVDVLGGARNRDGDED